MWQDYENALTRALQRCAVCLATAVAIALPLLPLPAGIAVELDPSEPTTLVEAPTPTRDVGTLLRDALPIHNAAIRDVQKSLEGIADCLKLPPEEAVTSIALVRWFRESWQCCCSTGFVGSGSVLYPLDMLKLS